MVNGKTWLHSLSNCFSCVAFLQTISLCKKKTSSPLCLAVHKFCFKSVSSLQNKSLNIWVRRHVTVSYQDAMVLSRFMFIAQLNSAVETVVWLFCFCFFSHSLLPYFIHYVSLCKCGHCHTLLSFCIAGNSYNYFFTLTQFSLALLHFINIQLSWENRANPILSKPLLLRMKPKCSFPKSQ